uniref:F-box domain-containing protein n=1 Tax=Steinernema glaseri TaxID=37863 RepID=A0A1I7XY73_9BILA
MDSVPEAFLDAVCCLLNSIELRNLKETQGGWSVKAAIHKSKRRELKVLFDVTNHERNEIKIEFKDLNYCRDVSPTLNAKYDRIRLIEVGLFATDELPESTSMECFKKKVLPAIRSLIFECKLTFALNKSGSENLTRIIFDSLRTSTQVTSVNTGNYGGHCLDFLKHKITVGHLSELILKGDWPADLQTALRLFVKSPNFKILDVGESNLTIDIYMVIAFVERFLCGNFSQITDLQGRPSFPLASLKELHRDKQQLSYMTPCCTSVQWSRSNGEQLIARRHHDGDISLFVSPYIVY